MTSSSNILTTLSDKKDEAGKIQFKKNVTKTDIAREYKKIACRMKRVINSLRLHFLIDEKSKFYQDCFHTWIKVGNGTKFAAYAANFSIELKNLLDNPATRAAYSTALSKGLFFKFFQEFPLIYDFFALMLKDKDSMLQQMHTSFWNPDNFKPIHTPLLTQRSTPEPSPIPKWAINCSDCGVPHAISAQPTGWKVHAPADYKSEFPAATVALIRSSDEQLTTFQLSQEEYDSTIQSLDIKDEEESDNSALAYTTLIRIKQVTMFFRKEKEKFPPLKSESATFTFG